MLWTKILAVIVVWFFLRDWRATLVAAAALLLGEPFMAEAALEMGLVSRIVPPSEVNALVQQQARKLAAKPLSSLIATKRLMKQGQAEAIAVGAGPFGSFNPDMRQKADQIAVVSRFRFTRDQTLETSVR